MGAKSTPTPDHQDFGQRLPFAPNAAGFQLRSNSREATMASLSLRTCALALATLATPLALAQQPAEVVVYGPAPKPVVVPGAKPITTPSFEAFKGEGLYHFQGARVSNIRAAATAGEGNRYALTETSNDPNADDAERQHRRRARRAQRRAPRARAAQLRHSRNDGSVYIVYAGQALAAHGRDAAGLRRVGHADFAVPAHA